MTRIRDVPQNVCALAVQPFDISASLKKFYWIHTQWKL